MKIEPKNLIIMQATFIIIKQFSINIYFFIISEFKFEGLLLFVNSFTNRNMRIIKPIKR